MAYEKRKAKKLIDMADKARKRIKVLEVKMEDVRFRLEDKVLTKAQFTKMKMDIADEIKGLRGRINRLDKQRLNLERRAKEEEIQEDEEWEKKEKAEAERARMEWKEERADVIQAKKKKKKKKAVARPKKKVLKKAKLSAEEKKVNVFIKAYVDSYRGAIKSEMKKKAQRSKFILYKNYPYMVTVVRKEGDEVLVVFYGPKHDDMVVDVIEEEKFDLANYKEIFHTCFITTKGWSTDHARAEGAACAKKDMYS